MVLEPYTVRTRTRIKMRSTKPGVPKFWTGTLSRKAVKLFRVMNSYHFISDLTRFFSYYGDEVNSYYYYRIVRAWDVRDEMRITAGTSSDQFQRVRGSCFLPAELSPTNCRLQKYESAVINRNGQRMSVMAGPFPRRPIRFGFLYFWRATESEWHRLSGPGLDRCYSSRTPGGIRNLNHVNYISASFKLAYKL